LALSHLARAAGCPATLAEATDAFNRLQVRLSWERIQPLLPARAVISILGLSYKPDTDVVEESQGVAMAQWLQSQGHTVRVHDPVALENARRVLGPSVAYCSTVDECVRETDAVLIMTAWNVYRSLSLPPSPRKPLLVDYWRVLQPSRYADSAVYVNAGTALERRRMP
jgi:UDPglucose 6-dehydrogenase